MNSKHIWLIKRPLISEKSTSALGQLNVAQFVVDKNATKNEIRQAVEDLFAVKVKAVRTAMYTGKFKRHQMKAGRRSNFKKAFVQLYPGEKISVFEQVTQG